MRALIILAVTTLAATTALAQTQRLPAPTNRAEQQVDAINDSLQQRQRSQGVNQQTQFEINALRGQAQRNAVTPPATFGGRPGCPAGSIGC